MKITGKQIAMARILLDLSQEQLAKKLGIVRKTVMRIENGQSPGSAKNLEKIRTYFENNGLEFTGEFGVNKTQSRITKLKGPDVVRTFYTDVYETIKQDGGGKMCLFNGVPKRLIEWIGQEWYDMHTERMMEMKDTFEHRIIVKEGEDFLVGSKYAQYKWFPEHLFNNKTMYCYNSKTAFFNYGEKDVEILIIDLPEFAENFRILFNIAWTRVAVDPPTQIKDNT